MRYTIETGSYNERRYGKPWIAEVHGKDFSWGEWEGRAGESGLLVIEAEPGALIARGQKDIRKGRGGVDGFYIAMPNGDLWRVHGEAKARQIARDGWRSFAESVMEDKACSNEDRIAAAQMLHVQDPFRKAAAELFGLAEAEKPTDPVEVSMDAFGL